MTETMRIDGSTSRDRTADAWILGSMLAVFMGLVFGITGYAIVKTTDREEMRKFAEARIEAGTLGWRQIEGGPKVIHTRRPDHDRFSATEGVHFEQEDLLSGEGEMSGGDPASPREPGTPRGRPRGVDLRRAPSDRSRSPTAGPRTGSTCTPSAGRRGGRSRAGAGADRERPGRRG